MASVFAISIVFWYATKKNIPDHVVLMTGQDGGLYHELGNVLSTIWKTHTGQTMEVRSSSGTIANLSALQEKEANLAILQGGTVSLEGMSIIAPLYPELVHIIVRKTSGITTVRELEGRQVIIGAPHSGMQKSALEIMRYHGMGKEHFQAHESYFMTLETNAAIDAAIVTAGIMHPDLRSLLNTGEYELIPVDYAEAIAMQNPFFIKMNIPKALYGHGTVSTKTDCMTVATTCLLVARADAAPEMITPLLNCVFEKNLWITLPSMLNKEDVQNWNQVRLHPRAGQFFNPSDRIGHMANIMESLAAFKELAVALIAGLYLLWDRWKRVKEKDIERRMMIEKDKLDILLTQTLTIERSQIRSSHVPELRAMLDKVTRIKLKALEELTHEALRGDRIFLIFITQCANLINKIQAKITQLNIEEAGLDINEKHQSSVRRRPIKRSPKKQGKVQTPGDNEDKLQGGKA